MEAINLICYKCKHFRRIEGGCDAFPDGIPEEITSGENKHEKPLPDQNNKIVFKPDLTNLTGEQLFYYYLESDSKYASVLFLAHMEIGDELYPMLEEAEKTGKKIVIKEDHSNMIVIDPPLTIVIK